jgi:inhibitor of cysteine peptidase
MKTLFISIFLVIVFCSGCILRNSKSNDIKVDHEIAINESFQIELVSNPTTGYSWKWTNKQTVSILDTFDFKYICEKPELLGSGGKEIWIFRGKKCGIDTIKLEYCRSWEPNSTVSTKRIIVKVK